MEPITWEPKGSLLYLQFEKEDIINCYVKHPECHYEKNIFCCEIDLEPKETWFYAKGKPGKCTYDEYLCYVFDQIYAILLSDKQQITEEDCKIAKGIIGPLSISATLIRDINEDTEDHIFKVKIEWDGKGLGKVKYTIH